MVLSTRWQDGPPTTREERKDAVHQGDPDQSRWVRHVGQGRQVGDPLRGLEVRGPVPRGTRWRWGPVVHDPRHQELDRRGLLRGHGRGEGTPGDRQDHRVPPPAHQALAQGRWVPSDDGWVQGLVCSPARGSGGRPLKNKKSYTFCMQRVQKLLPWATI